MFVRLLMITKIMILSIICCCCLIGCEAMSSVDNSASNISQQSQDDALSTLQLQQYFTMAAQSNQSAGTDFVLELINDEYQYQCSVNDIQSASIAGGEIAISTAQFELYTCNGAAYVQKPGCDKQLIVPYTLQVKDLNGEYQKTLISTISHSIF